MKIKRLNPEGLTLVELMVAIAVGAIVTISLTQVVNNYVLLGHRARNLSTVNAFVEAKVEALRNTGYNGLNVGSTSLTSELPDRLPPGSTSTLTISNPAGGIKQLQIAVTYKDQGNSKTYNYTTYVGELGVAQ